MNYANGTILARNEPKEGSAFNRVKVVGESPIKTTATGEWEGGPGEAIIVEPLDDFGAADIMPINVASEQYTIEFEPDPSPTHLSSAEPPRPTRQLTAEEQFRLKAKESKRK